MGGWLSQFASADGVCERGAGRLRGFEGLEGGLDAGRRGRAVRWGGWGILLRCVRVRVFMCVCFFVCCWWGCGGSGSEAVGTDELTLVIGTRLTLLSVHRPDRTFFSTDSELLYYPFCADFGPLNFANVYRFCKIVNQKLEKVETPDTCTPEWSRLENGKHLRTAFTEGFIAHTRHPTPVQPSLKWETA